PPCRDEYPLVNGFAVRYAEAGLVVLAVHVKEGADAVRILDLCHACYWGMGSLRRTVAPSQTASSVRAS
ncbi:MAG: hypothetical protein RL479_1511, partial [Verrucomicrobiota bacterium]